MGNLAASPSSGGGGGDDDGSWWRSWSSNYACRFEQTRASSQTASFFSFPLSSLPHHHRHHQISVLYMESHYLLTTHDHSFSNEAIACPVPLL